MTRAPRDRGRPLTSDTPLARLMLARDLTRADVARLAGVSVSTVRDLLAGRLPRMRTAKAVALALRVPVGHLWP